MQINNEMDSCGTGHALWKAHPLSTKLQHAETTIGGKLQQESFVFLTLSEALFKYNHQNHSQEKEGWPSTKDWPYFLDMNILTCLQLEHKRVSEKVDLTL